MAKLYITEIKENENLEIILLVIKKELLISKSGKPYLNLLLQDKSGQIEGKVWENAPQISVNFEKEDIINIKSRVLKYQGKLQLNVQNIKKISDSEIEISDFLPTTKKNVDVMIEQLKKGLYSIKDRFLRELCLSFLQDSDFMAKFKSAPAATVIHHAYLGGLLEHSLSISQIVEDLCRQYQFVNKDILLSCSFLHDIGKIKEYKFSRTFSFTDCGKLLGHIIMGLEMVMNKIGQIPDFPDELKMQVEHMLISHHGDYDFGSPKKPKTIEALILHLADELDSKISGMHSYIMNEVSDNENWTKYHKYYERYIYRKLLLENMDRVEVKDMHEKLPQHLDLFNG